MDAWPIYADLLSGCIVCSKSTGFRAEDNDFFLHISIFFSPSLVHIDD